MEKRALVIIPAFNEEHNIEGLLLQFKSLYSLSLDVLVVNDCSTDKTVDICTKAKVPVISLPCNLGIGGAVQTGYKFAERNNYEYAIQVDGDGQHDPSYIKNLLDPLLNDEADLVIGSRYIDKMGFQSSLMRRAGITYFSKLLGILTKEIITDPTSGFRACNRNIIELFAKRYPIDYPEPESIMYLKRKRLRIKEVPVIMRERVGGKSSITSLRSLYYMMKVSLAIIIDRMRRQIA